MDLIRIFAETSFAHISERYCDNSSSAPEFCVKNLMIDESAFVDECRLHHKELSDDQIRMIYGVFRDDWSESCEISDSENPENQNIFNVLFKLSQELLRDVNGIPKVKFQHLFRWREVSQLLGEDIFAMALLAFENRHQRDNTLNFPSFEKIPSVLHNDNPHLDYIFRTVGLCELHSHLKAATDNFTISWVCLMNHISKQGTKFKKLAEIQDPSRKDYVSGKMYNAVAEAAYVRYALWQHITNDLNLPSLTDKYSIEENRIELDDHTKELRSEANDYDYIYVPNSGNMSVFVGERKFLYSIFLKILSTNDFNLHKLFYRYILRKNQLRAFLVQVNDNTGFGNFKRFQDLKSKFLMPNYERLLTILPIWEARVFNYNTVYEARVAPVKPTDFKKIYHKIKDELKDLKDIEFSILFHFIKEQETKEVEMTARDFILRYKNLHNSIKLKHIHKYAIDESMASAIDAASSELYCRPETFAQSFRFLKKHGYFATFHAGEDFYDLADGLRAISEAIEFLGLEAGDRIGHAIALGLDPIRFYSLRHNYIAIPQQWMLDNVVWLYYYSRKHNVSMAPATEEFILKIYRKLIWSIGYRNPDHGSIDISDYYQSMMLRGDNPKYYKEGRFNKRMHNEVTFDGESWHSFDLQQQNKDLEEIRRFNTVAVQLYSDYHFDKQIRQKGKLIKSYLLPEGYPNLIFELQNKMIQKISKCRLGIECCPSSNLRIGHLEKFENHPIFRFMPVHEPESRYPLPVTVNTDDLGIFATSLPNEFSLLALALLKKKDDKGNHVYSSQEVYDWIKRVVENGHKYHFKDDRAQIIQDKENDDI